MSKYVIEIKGLFGSLYVASAQYNRYQSTVKEIERAYRFATLSDAQKQANYIKGRSVIVEVKDENEEDANSSYYDLIRCEKCSYYDGVVCRRTQLPVDSKDFCSRGFAKR